MKPTLYFAPWCPDTEPFVSELKALGVIYEPVDMTAGGANLKAFLKLRDSHSAFVNTKQKGNIGIPALLLENGEVVLDKDKLKEIFA
ncbi:glutaredoxin-related protein [Mesocricetibacter intestinalis]|uniref:Glutaredoxin-related protein n=1 Tax=Mesocricetibacter intestinalis TaxID=1521930 RepID=A0A4R6VAS1_9PAST|nr:hypothetical protein [Mesocricetibacter intestinalis]TDQ56405.1 glutaredoxin-related protein [Mesocricetibacter intestinalis]